MQVSRFSSSVCSFVLAALGRGGVRARCFLPELGPPCRTVCPRSAVCDAVGNWSDFSLSLGRISSWAGAPPSKPGGLGVCALGPGTQPRVARDFASCAGYLRAGGLGGRAWAIDDRVTLSLEPLLFKPTCSFPISPRKTWSLDLYLL